MPFYLSEYIGAGTRQDPFRPVGSDQPGWSAIDLRPDCSRADGGGLSAALVKVPVAFSDPRARFLADDKLESLTNQQKNFLTNRLGLDLSSPNLLRDIIATILTAPPANGWKALRPSLLRWEIWLGELIWEAPRASGGASDNFNRADGDIAVGVPAWEKRSSGGYAGLASVVSNVASSGDAIYRYVGAAATNDQYAQLTRGAGTANQGGPAVRVAPTAAGDPNLCYAYDSFGGQAVYKVVTSTFTSLGAIASGAPSPGDTIRVEANGSSIDLYIRGVHDANYPKTDTAVTTGQPGFFNYETFDDWSGGDLGAAPMVDSSPPIAFDAATESVRTGTTDPHTFTHTPVGTPRGIVLAIIHGTSSTDHATGPVTYGGVAMSRITRAADTVTEPGAAELWFLGSGIPTGAQTVSVDLASATTDDIEFVCISLTTNDGGAVEVVSIGTPLTADQANPSITLPSKGKVALAIAALYGGGAAPSSFTPNANCVEVASEDLGAFYGFVLRQTTPSNADFAIGGTASSDDVAYVAANFANARRHRHSAAVGQDPAVV